MAKKPTVTTLASGFNSTETLNTNFEALRDAFDNTLSLDGSTPNAMEADLDLNGNNIIGAAGLLINGTDYLADVTAAKAAALVAQAAAETAETNAETAETNAEASETAAGLSATASATSATAAAASEAGVDADRVAAQAAATTATTKASEASTSETNAATSASTATTKASEAATSATNAATSATESETAKTAAEAAKDAALAALDSFDDRYLGAKASDPTTDNDGNALVAGALYYNTTSDVMKVYEGSVWVAAYASLSGALLATNNLSDLTNATSARTNLGLVTVASTGAYSDLTSTPTLGTAAATASTDYATAAQGTLAASAQQPPSEGAFVNGDKTKLDGIEASADVTDTANVTSAGALMDSELTAIASVKALNQGVATTDSPTFDTVTATGDITTTGNITAGTNFTMGAASNSNIKNTLTTSIMTVSGGSSTTLGANFRLYGEAHASQANNITFRQATTTQLKYDDSASSWDFKANDITTTGDVTATAFAGDGSALTGVGGSTTYGAVGTYALLYANVLTQRTPGDTLAGSSLYPANAFTDGASSGEYTGGGAASGTWRLMGNTGYYNGTTTLSRRDLMISIWIRIS